MMDTLGHFELYEISTIIMSLVAIALIGFKIGVLRHDRSFLFWRLGVIVTALYVACIGILVVYDVVPHHPTGVIMGSVPITLFMLFEIKHSIKTRW